MSQNSPALDAYQNLDLGPPSQRLMARVGDEAQAGKIVLTATGDDGALGQGLTPEMNQWLSQEISPMRAPALADLNGQARDIKIVNNVDGLLLEVEHDKIEREKARRTLQVLEGFNRDHGELLRNVDRLQGEYDELRTQNDNRDAKTPNIFLEFGLLLPVIMIPEAMLNFESFRRAPIIQSDAMALGATILVGFGIAAAAYCFGLFVRRYNYYARPLDPERKRAGWPLYTFGTLALLVSLGSVGAARYYYLLPRIQEAIVTGAPIPNVPISVGALLFGNLICFLIGAIITFFLNDPDPDYADKAHDLKNAKRKLDKVFKSKVSSTLDEVNARGRVDREKASRKAAQMSGKQGYNQLREKMDKLKAKDAAVVGALQQYRSALVRAMKDRGAHVEITMREPSQDAHNPVSVVKIERFQAIPLHLSWSL